MAATHTTVEADLHRQKSIQKLSCSLVSVFTHKQEQTHDTAERNRNKHDFHPSSDKYIHSYST